MYYEAIKAKYIKDYKLEITFENGKKGIIDFKEYKNKGGVFSRFLDIEYFKQFYINEEVGVLCWPEGLDIAPETLYNLATGVPLPDWMSKSKKQSTASKK